MVLGMSRSVAVKLGTSGGAMGWFHIHRCSGVLSEFQVPMGYSRSGAAFAVLLPALEALPVHRFLSSGRALVDSGVGVRQTLLGPGVGLLGVGMGSCLLE